MLISAGPPDATSRLSQVIRSQNSIGWTSLLYGWLACDWQLAQDDWLMRQSTRWKKSSLQWAIKFVRLSLDLIWGMWEHCNAVLHDPSHPWSLGREAPF